MFLLLVFPLDITSYFKPTRGLCQGDPVSPLLFIINLEELNVVINREKILNGGSPFPLLMFPNDVVFFSKVGIYGIKTTIQTFQGASGQWVNFSNCQALFIMLTLHLWIQKLSKEVVYLGCPYLLGI